jgi:hypothetical protein
MEMNFYYIYRKRIYFLLSILLFFFVTEVFAGNSLRKGTCGALELVIPIGSRGTSMGGAVVTDIKGTEAIYWNPAGVANSEKTEAVFSYLDYIAGIKYSFIGITTNLGNFGSLGFNTRVVDVGDIIVTTEESPEGTGEIITPNFMIVGVTYSRQMTDRVFFGGSFSFINERIMQEVAKGVAFDFGFQYIPESSGLKFGVVMKNIGPKLRFDGSDLDKNIHLPSDDPQAAHRNARLELASFELPSYLQFGTSYDVKIDENKKLILAGSFRNNNFFSDEFSGGIEFNFKDEFMLRGGYLASSEKEYIYGFNFGFGLCLHFGENTLAFDYSNAQTKYFDNNQWFTLKLSF